MLKTLSQRIDPDLRRIFRYILPEKLNLFVAFWFVLGSAGVSSLIAMLLGKLTDAGFYQGEGGAQEWVLWAAPAALVGVSVIYVICTVMSAYMLARVSQNVLLRLRLELFESMLNWRAEQYLSIPVGKITSKFVNEANTALGGAANSLIIIVRDLTQVIALICLLIYYNWTLTLVTLVTGPLIAVAMRMISKRIRRVVKDSQEALAVMIGRVQESYEAERLVKISNTYDFEDERFKTGNENIRRLAVKTQKLQGLSTPISQNITMFGVSLVVGAALLQAQAGLLTMGEFMTFLTAMLLLKAPIQRLSDLNATVASISVAAHSIFEALDAPREEETGTVDAGRLSGGIEFDNVCLRYPGADKDALKNICLRVAPGEHIAFVGLSGSGKSSLVNLIPRFWEYTGGRLAFDGIEQHEFTLNSLRRNISLVSQEVVLFDDTIRFNVAYGTPDATDEQIWGALEAASLADFVRSLPKGLDSPVGDEGSLLSGGQKQRVSIARALLRNSPILILDEATSALDSESEHHIKEALRRLMQGRTCLTVAHRFSAIEHADRIAVMSAGEITELGTHEELMAVNGTYAGLYRLQCAQPDVDVIGEAEKAPELRLPEDASESEKTAA